MNRKSCTNRLFDLFPDLLAMRPAGRGSWILKAEFRPWQQDIFLNGRLVLSLGGRTMVEEMQMQGSRSVLDHAAEMDSIEFMRRPWRARPSKKRKRKKVDESRLSV